MAGIGNKQRRAAEYAVYQRAKRATSLTIVLKPNAPRRITAKSEKHLELVESLEVTEAPPERQCRTRRSEQVHCGGANMPDDIPQQLRLPNPVSITTGVKLRGPERSEGHVSFNGRVMQHPPTARRQAHRQG